MITKHHCQTQGAYGSFCLPVMAGSLISPYFLPMGGINPLTKETMRAIIERFDSGLPGNVLVVVDYLNGSSYVSTYGSEVDITGVSSNSDLVTATEAVINIYATSQSYTLSEGIIWPAITAANIPVPSFNNSPSASIVTGTGATGTQISATRIADVNYSPTMVTTASIAGSASDVIVLEICSTNSATAGNWIEIARVTNAQALSLAITLQSVQTTSGVLSGTIPAGWYRKIRARRSGTVTNSMASGQEVLR